MDVCSRNPNRTAPDVSEGGVRRTDLPLCSRTNGWSWPPHPFQLLAWLLYLYFAVTGFGVFVPLLPKHWIPAGYICTGIMFACHLVVHLMAVSIDPADSNVRAKSYKAPVPMFDRTKHAHVIENCHCYLCQVDVGPKSKHCSACNKCVASFDHHCRWLNNCVGSRNYKMFLNSVISALVGISLVLLISSYVFIQYFLDPTQLRSDKHFLVRNETGVWFVFLPVAPVTTAGAAIPALAAVTVALGLLSTALLGHLLCFHIYLMWNRLSTYEYIVRQRHRQEHRGTKGASDTRLPSINLLKEASYSGSLGYTNPDMEVENTNTMALAAHGAPDSFYGNGRVRSAPSHVGEEELQATVSTDHALGHTHNHTHSTQRQKKKRKVHKVPAEVNMVDEVPMETTGNLRQHRTIEHRTQKNPTTIDSASLPLVSVPPPPPSQRLPFPAFPLRSSLPPLPAGPPADYHSSSAESLEEIPVVLARLGSSSSAVSSAHARDHHQRAAPLRQMCAQVAPPSPFPRTKRKPTSSSVRSKGRLSVSQPPSVFVSRTSGQPLRPTRDLTLSLGPHRTDMEGPHVETMRTY